MKQQPAPAVQQASCDDVFPVNIDTKNIDASIRAQVIARYNLNENDSEQIEKAVKYVMDSFDDIDLTTLKQKSPIRYTVVNFPGSLPNEILGVKTNGNAENAGAKKPVLVSALKGSGSTVYDYAGELEQVEMKNLDESLKSVVMKKYNLSNPEQIEKAVEFIKTDVDNLKYYKDNVFGYLYFPYSLPEEILKKVPTSNN